MDPGFPPAKPSDHPFIRLDASAGERRSEKMMLQ
jgi:hypothetical protein